MRCWTRPRGPCHQAATWYAPSGWAATIGRDASSLADGLDALHAAYGHLHWVHVLPNAATIAFALARGAGELGPSITAAVSAGWDTDSAGATVGSVVGALVGGSRLEERWTAPLRGRIATSLPGPATRQVADLVTRTLALQEGSA